MPNTPTAPAALDLDAHCHDCGLEIAREGGCPDHPAPKPRTDDGGEILDPAILERQRARREAYAAAGITPEMAALGVYPCRIPHLNAIGAAKNVYSRGDVVAVSVRLVGESRAAEMWSPSQVEAVRP